MRIENADAVVTYAAYHGFSLVESEAQLFINYIVEGNDYFFETDAEMSLYLVDVHDFFGETSMDFFDLLEMLTKNVVELLNYAMSACIANDTEFNRSILDTRISDEKTVSGMWDRFAEKLLRKGE